MKHFLLFVCTFIALTSCRHHEDETEKPNRSMAERTVMVYISAENNLSSTSDANLNDMLKASKKLTDGQHLVVFVDNASSKKPAIIEIKNGIRDTIKLYDTDFYASDPARFREIIQTIENEFPANSYGLVLWGHARGWLIEKDSIADASRQQRAYGIDSGNNLSIRDSFGSKWMNITQMARALKDLPIFDFIFADCCCMMCVESAYELRHAAKYLIGSPAEVPSDGAPYETIIPLLFSQADDFYVDIVDTYFNYYKDSYYIGHSLPMSAVDLQQMEYLASETRAMLKAPEEYDLDSLAHYFRLRNDLPVMYDMCSLMKKNLDENNFTQWEKALNQAVPHRRFSLYWLTSKLEFDVFKQFGQTNFSEDNYGGISMFVPQPGYNFSKNYDYNNDIKKMEWYDAIGWSRFQ